MALSFYDIQHKIAKVYLRMAKFNLTRNDNMNTNISINAVKGRSRSDCTFRCYQNMRIGIYTRI